MKEQIEARLAELEKERDTFVRQMNAQMGAFNGGIAELKRLLQSTGQTPPEHQEATNG